MTDTEAVKMSESRIYADWRRRLSEHEWSCQCGCEPMSPDIDTVRRCLKDMADEIDRLRLVEIAAHALIEKQRAVVDAAREWTDGYAQVVDDFDVNDPTAHRLAHAVLTLDALASVGGEEG